MKPKIDKREIVTLALNRAQRALAILEEQVAGYGSLAIPTHQQIELEDKRKEVADLEAQLKSLPIPLNEAIRAYLQRIQSELRRYEDTANIVFPALKPGKEQEKDLARNEEKRVQDFLRGFNPTFSQINPYILKPDDAAQEEELEPFLLKHNRVVLLGDPGSGKSTALRGLFTQFAKRWETNPSSIVPIFVQLNRWQPGLELLEFLQKEARELTNELPSMLKKGKLLLLFDGLNELPALKRTKHTQEIDDSRPQTLSLLGKEYPNVLCLLSCRVKEFIGGPGWRDLHVLPFQREQVEAITYAYFGADTAQAARLISELYEGKQEKLRTLAEKPFYLRKLLSFFGTLGSLPENPALLLAYSVDKAIDVEIEKGLCKLKEKKELKKRMSLLAFNMTMAGRTSNIEKELAEVWLFKKFKTKSKKRNKATSNQKASAKRLRDLAEKVGLLIQSEETIQYNHQLFQEYFCANYCITQSKTNFTGILKQATEYGFKEVWLIWNGLDKNLFFKASSELTGSKINMLKGRFGNWKNFLSQRGTIASALISEVKKSDISDYNKILSSYKFMYLEKGFLTILSVRLLFFISALIFLLIKPQILIIYLLIYILWRLFLIIPVKRQLCALALGYIGDVTTIPLLIYSLNDNDPLVRQNAARSLGIIRRRFPEVQVSDNLHVELAKSDTHERSANRSVEIEYYIKAQIAEININPEQANDYYTRGIAYYEIKEYELAIKDFTQAILLNPDNHHFYHHRAHAYHSLNKHELSIEDFTKAVHLNPKDPNNYGCRGLVYQEIKEYELAIDDFNRVALFTSRPTKFYNHKGISYLKLEQYKSGIESFNQAILENPNDDNAFHNRAHCYQELTHYERALQDFNKAVSLNPRNPKNYECRGTLYRELEQYGRAIEDYNKAISLNPNIAAVFHNRGYSYSELKQYGRAIEDYNKAISLNPKDPNTFHCRGVAYRELKQNKRAIEDFKQAAILNPKDSEVYNNEISIIAKPNKKA